MSNQSKLTQWLAGLSTLLYTDRFHLIKSLTFAVNDCGLRLGTVGMGPVHLGIEDSGGRAVCVFGLSGGCRYIVFNWKTTERGNLEAEFSLI